MDFVIMFDAFIGILGLYLIYASVKMNRTGEISTVLVSREDIAKCKDKRGFIDFMYKKTLLFGCVSALFGVFVGINDSVYFFGQVFNVAGMLVFLGIWIWFTMQLRKGRAQYFY